MDRLEGLRTFVTVVVLGSFAQAGKALDVAPSAITKRIADLERRLGVQLLLRTTRQLRLTEAGTRYFQQAQRLLMEFDQLDRGIIADPEALSGDIRMCCTTSLGASYVAPRLCGFRTEHPGVNFDLILLDRPVDPVAEAFDLVIADKPYPVARDATEYTFCPSRRVVCASPAYLERRGRPAIPQDLAGHECIHYSFLPTGSNWTFQLASGEAGGEIIVPIRSTFSTSNAIVMRSIALAGGGIALLPSHVCAADLASGALVPLLQEYAVPQYWVRCILPPLSRVTARVTALVEHLRELFVPVPPWEREPAGPAN